MSEPSNADPTSPRHATGDDPELEILQAVVDRVVSWQTNAPEGTVEKELDDALSEAGVDLDQDARRRIAERVHTDGSHFDVREVLGR